MKKYRYVFKVKPKDVYSACKEMNSSNPGYHSHVVQVLSVEDYYIILIELDSPYPALINS